MWLYLRLPDGRETLVQVVSVTVSERALIYRPAWAPGAPVELGPEEFEAAALLTPDNAAMIGTVALEALRASG